MKERRVPSVREQSSRVLRCDALKRANASAREAKLLRVGRVKSTSRDGHIQLMRISEAKSESTCDRMQTEGGHDLHGGVSGRSRRSLPSRYIPRAG